MSSNVGMVVPMGAVVGESGVYIITRRRVWMFPYQIGSFSPDVRTIAVTAQMSLGGGQQ